MIILNVRALTLIKLNFWIWMGVSFLYSFELSDLLAKVDVNKVHLISLSIPFLFIIGYFFANIFLYGSINLHKYKKTYINYRFLLDRTKKLTIFFIIIAIIEVFYCGYIPLISMLQGEKISQFDFGIKSVHGFLMSLGALLFTAWFLIYYLSREKVALFWLFIIIFIFALFVTRKMMVVSLLQASILALILRENNKNTIKLILFAFLALIIFGIIGDIRTGRELFLSLSHFSGEYPDWLPTGFGWVYIYVTTPIANLVSAIDMTSDFSFDLSFMKGLLPSFIRDLFFEIDDDAFDNIWQISGSFNVGTGFLSLYESFGYLGIAIFNILLGISYRIVVSNLYKLRYLFILVVFSCATLLLLFSNSFFNLNVISQVVFSYFFYGLRSNKLINYN